ncbi:pyruvoyl-dependent arginine decarboxylase [Candidatus Woesearchaeota archaeon]|nr:pyruvoyl-dependent arginine decarboxylase [Candidatus Woesearchaeota archaeon]MBW2993967.1 pyruvoyl-dependent arginine decarboxylase [Candidatus Woesearchaeota archaeon]
MSYEKIKDPQKTKDSPRVLVGNIVPKDFFIVSGTGQSDITIHAGSFHLALREARIERCNIMTYSSILPAIANKIEFNPDLLTQGAELKTIMARADVKQGERATAAIMFGWLYDKKTGEKFGGIVVEYNGGKTEEDAIAELKLSIQELYTHGYSEDFDLKDIETHSKSFVPDKKFGTALVALCFVNFEQTRLN